ncbi:hypothetical protein HYR99_06395 [Candidatus Poribacteria bacterium]|nr:hypothetical protein [Candidatus Poribacteria bacterium]
MQPKQKLPVPPITAAKKEAEFWENHSALDYDLNFSSEPLDVHPDAWSVPINLRLPRWLVNDIKALAQEGGIPYQRFIRQVLIAFVESRQQRERTSE